MIRPSVLRAIRLGMVLLWPLPSYRHRCEDKA